MPSLLLIKLLLFGMSLVFCLFSSLINQVILTIPFIEYTVSIAAMGLFGMLYSAFDKWIWKWEFLKKIGLVQTPNLIGNGKGEFISSYNEFEKSFPAELIVEQTWLKICIRGKFNNSMSSSYTASIKVNDGGGIKLLYSYYNDKYPEHYRIRDFLPFFTWLDKSSGYQGKLVFWDMEIKGKEC